MAAGFVAPPFTDLLRFLEIHFWLLTPLMFARRAWPTKENTPHASVKTSERTARLIVMHQPAATMFIENGPGLLGKNLHVPTRMDLN